MTVAEAIAELADAKGNYRCSQMVRLLESLGFVVRRRRKPSHWLVMHPGLADFRGTGFACPHRGGAGMKRRYIDDIRKILMAWQDELEELT